MSAISTFLYTLGGLISFSLVIVLIVFISKLRKIAPSIPPRAPIVYNFMDKFTKGHSSGFEIKSEKGPKGRYHCEFLPNDLAETYNEDGELIMEKPEIQKIVVENRLVIPSGESGKNREKVWYLPKMPTELPPTLVKSQIGDVLIDHVNDFNILKKLSSSMEEKDNRQRDLIKKTAGGEYTHEEMDRLTEFVQDIIKMSQMSQNTQISGGIPGKSI